MNSPVNGLRVAGLVFGIASLLQLVRLLAGADVMIDGYAVPLWASGVAFIVAGALSAWMARLTYRFTI